MEKAYVVSQDIKLLLKEWSLDKDLSLPDNYFFDELRKDFENYMKKIFSNFQFITEDELTKGINHLIHSTNIPIVSLDRVYCKTILNLDVTRSVDKNGNEVCLENRPGALSIEKQIEQIKSLKIKEIALVDDVIYSGSLIEKIIKLIQNNNMWVRAIYAGIGIKDGVARIKTNGTKIIKCVKYFNSVLDEICERDFYPGVPLCGRFLSGSQNTGLPYLLPFGNPEKWASIPQNKINDFSKFCINQSIKLFEEIEKQSNRKIMCYELSRQVINCKDGRFIDQLRLHL